MEKIVLQAVVRPTQSPESLRKQGMIPAIVYGQTKQTEHLAISFSDFVKAFKKAGESTLLDLVVDGKTKSVIIQDIQKHYLTGKAIHADFYEVSMTEKLKAHVALEFTGIPKAVKELGGTLVTVISEIEVECLPADLPHNISIDISGLATFEDAIHVSDLKKIVGSKVEILTNEEDVIVKVAAPRDVEKELSEPVVEDVSKVEGAAETPKPGEGEEADGKKSEDKKSE